ncbi:hypothetical protein [Kitasatospora sp. NPDC094015]|uniref:hypothetical protein n=1 Tax=Kitasatospora sp. NPDC094015 TaxID=3155205 RepID=UPI00331D51F2
MKSKDTAFVGGPLDGRVLPILLNPFHNVGRFYRVPVPAHSGLPATTLVYRRAKEYDPKGRWRWRYEYDPEGGTGPRGDWTDRLPWSRRPAGAAAGAGSEDS